MELADTRPRLDEQLDALAHVERRRLLAALVDGNPRGETSIGIDEREDAETRSAFVAMRHQHLPKLEDQGFVQWDRGDSRVSRGPKFDEIEPLVEFLTEHWDEI